MALFAVSFVVQIAARGAPLIDARPLCSVRSAATVAQSVIQIGATYLRGPARGFICDPIFVLWRALDTRALIIRPQPVWSAIPVAQSAIQAAATYSRGPFRGFICGPICVLRCAPDTRATTVPCGPWILWPNLRFRQPRQIFVAAFAISCVIQIAACDAPLIRARTLSPAKK